MKISPSLLAADFTDLAGEINMINTSEADYLHLDIMDGVFVPNISFGFPVINDVSRICRKPLDVHLMVVEPEKWIRQVKEVGGHIMNVHYEACRHLYSTVKSIHDAGMQAGVTLCPATPVSVLADIIQDLELVLIMSVEPGFGGQPFIEHSLEKIRVLRRLIEETGSHALIEVDGGVNRQTGKALKEAGADILVAGSAVFRSQDPSGEISALKGL